MKNSSDETLETLETLHAQPPRALRMYQVMARLGVSTKTVHKLVKMGLLRRCEINRRLHLYLEEDVARLLKSNIITEQGRVDRIGIAAEGESCGKLGKDREG